MKKFTVVLGHARGNGNTEALTEVFIDRLRENGCEVQVFSLLGKEIKSCIGCIGCQRDYDNFACVQKDGVDEIAQAILDSDVIVLSSPIYSWYCTPSMKTLVDRLVIGMNKYYTDKDRKALWAGKELALITTCGYEIEKGTDIWEEGMKRYAKHSKLKYRGMLAERYFGFKRNLTDEKKEHAEQFADQLGKED
jgi:multimeric flavodoxin WrbA